MNTHRPNASAANTPTMPSGWRSRVAIVPSQIAVSIPMRQSSWSANTSAISVYVRTLAISPGM